MDPYLIILRLVHIVAGVFWAGAAFSLAMFIMPAINTSMPEGGKVMQRMMTVYHFPVYLLTAAALTILSGLLMYANLSRGFNMVWIGSPHGIVLTIGALSSIISFLLGIFVNKPRADRMARIGREVMQTGGQPTSSQVAEMTALRQGISSMTKYIAILVLIAVITMAVAKYVN